MNATAKLEKLKRQAETAPPPASPIGFARLAKLNLEIERLTVEVRQAIAREKIEQGETLALDTAREIFGRPHQVVRDQLGTLAKRFAPRLVGQPQKAIERTLADEAARIVNLCRSKI